MSPDHAGLQSEILSQKKRQNCWGDDSVGKMLEDLSLSPRTYLFERQACYFPLPILHQGSKDA